VIKPPMEPEFRDPPADAHPWKPVVDKLIARTGEWAVVYRGDPRSAGQAKRNINRGYRPWNGHAWDTHDHYTDEAREIFARHRADCTCRKEEQK
jgi:hypothetical protein